MSRQYNIDLFLKISCQGPKRLRFFLANDISECTSRSELWRREIDGIISSAGTLSVRPTPGRKIVLPRGDADRLRTALRRTLQDSERVVNFLNPSGMPGPGCKLLGVPRVLSDSLRVDRLFVRRLVMACATRMYAALATGERTTRHARKVVYYASQLAFLNRVLCPAGYVISPLCNSQSFLQGGEWVQIRFGVHQLFPVATWFLSNAGLREGERLLALMRELEMEE